MTALSTLGVHTPAQVSLLKDWTRNKAHEGPVSRRLGPLSQGIVEYLEHSLGCDRSSEQAVPLDQELTLKDKNALSSHAIVEGHQEECWLAHEQDLGHCRPLTPPPDLGIDVLPPSPIPAGLSGHSLVRVRT